MTRQLVLVAAALLLAGCGISTVPLYERRQLERQGWTPEEINSLQQERAVKEVSDGLNGIHFTTVGELRAQRNQPPRKCSYCRGTGFVGPYHIGCFACDQTGYEGGTW